MSKENTIQTSGQLDAKKKMNKKKRKKAIKTIIIVAIVAVVVVFCLFKSGIIGKNDVVKATTLTTYTVGTRNISDVLTSSGTITPNDQYTINALVSGEIISDYFEEGDTVIEDQLLYMVDSDNLNSSVTRAENALKNANKALNKALENLEKLNVESEFSGTVKKLYVEEGDEINSGTLIADVIDDRTMCIDIPFMSVDASSIKVGDKAIVTFDTYEEQQGTVTEIDPVSKVNALGVSVKNITISVKNTGSITNSTSAYARVGDAYCTDSGVFYYNDEGKIYAKVSGEVSKVYYEEGDIINDGNIIIRLESEDLEEQIEKLQDNVEEAEDSLSDANDAFKNYNIEAPITGKVISKSYKAGDTISGGQGSNTLAVIYDMSALKFTMSIDELDIDKLEVGQEVIVTCDSREGEEYQGVISNISIQGSTSSGTTVYPVEVIIKNEENIAKRRVDESGVVSKTYKTGMTSTETTYNLVSRDNAADGIVYTYSDDIRITVSPDGTMFDGEKQLKPYLDGIFTQGSNFYNFSDDYSKLILEVQNDKKMLRPGMNINAEIIVENRENVVAVPLAAVGRGNVVKVLRQKDADEPETSEDKQGDKKDADENTKTDLPEHPRGDAYVKGGFSENSKEGFNGEMPEGVPSNFRNNEGAFNGEHPSFGFGAKGSGGAYGTADINSEYDEVRVKIGISDDDYVEIISGLKTGDIVIIDSSNLASGFQANQFGMMGGGMMGGMPSGMGGMSSGRMPSGNMGAGRMPTGGMSGPMGR